MQNKLHWDIIDLRYFGFIRSVSECLNCGYKGTKWAECDSFILESGDRETFCPECKSSLYYLVNDEVKELEHEHA